MAKTTVKEYSVVGVSFHNGAWAVRYANSAGRQAVLLRNGHTDVHMYVMDVAGHKMDCVDALLDVLDEGDHGLPLGAVEAIQAEARELGFVL
jgi:hypothetical protein